MKMAMGGFVLFAVVLFVMYLMLRSCKDKKEKKQGGGQAQKRASKFSPYANVADTTANDSVDLEL